MAQKRPKKKKNTLDEFQLMDLDLNRFFEDAIAVRGLLPLLDGLIKACTSRAESFQEDLEKEQHPSVRVMCEDEVEFFDDAASWIDIARASIRSDWKDREMPSAADGDSWRCVFSKRASDAGHAHLEDLLARLNDPNINSLDWEKTAALVAKEGGTIWRDHAGKPNFELGRLWQETTASLIDPNVPETEKREAAALYGFITRNAENRAESGASA